MIIAEISQNFTCLAEAKELVRLAKENGADLAKAQLFDSMKLYGKKVPAELSFEDAKALFDYGASIGIEVFFSVFDVERVGWCEEIGVKRYKVAYSQRANWDLKETILKLHLNGLPVEMIVSTQSPYEVGDILLYCVSNYPASLSDLHFNNVDWERFSGFSDHTVDIDVAKIALARGAQIIEKHFAINHETGVDAPWSMTPEELRELKRFETVVKQVL